MPCDDRQLTDAQREEGFNNQRTGVQRGIRPFSGEATPENIVDYIQREVYPVLQQARDKVNEVYLQAVDNAPSGNPLAFYFSTTTTNADPTAGYIRLDQATQDTATTIRVSQSNARLVDVAPWLDVMAGSATTPLGTLALMDAINPGRFLRFDLDSMTDQGAYWDLGVTIIESSHDNPFVNDGSLVIAFTPGVSSAGSTVPAASMGPVTGPTILGRETGTGAVEELTGGEAGHLIKKAVDISVTVTTDQNDWAPTGLATADHIFVSTSGNDITITGIDGSSFAELEGTEFVVWLTSTGSITFSNNSASSTSGNRLLCPIAAGNTFRIGQQEGIKFRRNGLFWYALPHGPLLAGDAMGDRIRFDGVISATIAATTHNWSPTGLATAHSIYLTLTGSQTLTGIDSTVFAGSGGATAAGRSLLLHVTDASDTLTLSNNSINSSVGNRFNGQTPAVNVKVRPGQTVWLRHESNFWVPRLLEGPLLTNQVLCNATAVTDSPQGLSISTDSLLARIASNLVSHPFSTVAGAGLTYSSGALAVGAGTGMTVNANDVAWNGVGTFDDTVSVGTFRNLDFTSGTGINLTAVDNGLGTSTAVVGAAWDGTTNLVTGWAGVLAKDASSGANNPVVDTGQYLQVGSDTASLPASGDIRKQGTLSIVSGPSSAGMLLQCGLSSLMEIIGGEIELDSSGDVLLAATDDILAYGDRLRVAGGKTGASQGYVQIQEGASSGLTVAAGDGMFWVRSDTPNTPMFTDDANTDFVLARQEADMSWTGDHDFGAQVSYTGTFSTTLSAQANDLSVGDVCTLMIALTGNQNMSGIAGGTSNRVLFIFNNDLTDTLTLLSENAGSTASNRFNLPNNANFAIPPLSGVMAMYTSRSRWQILVG